MLETCFGKGAARRKPEPTGSAGDLVGTASAEDLKNETIDDLQLLMPQVNGKQNA